MGVSRQVEPMTIQGIILDFGGVFTKTRPRDIVLHRCEQQLGLASDALLGLLFTGEHWWSVSTGSISPDRYWQQFRDALQREVPPILEPFKYNPWAYDELNAATIALARRLHRRFKIGLLSNATPYLEVLIAQYSLTDLFDIVVNSARVGLRKPDPEIYRLALAGLGLDAQKCLFIDDKERNTEVAQTLGMEVVVFRSAAHLERQLRNRQVLS